MREGVGFRDRTPDFEAENVALLGISYDSIEDNRAWAEDMGFGFSLLSDTTRSVGAACGVQRPPDDKFAAYPERATFVIDPEGTVRLAYLVAPDQIDSHASQVLEDLLAIKSG